MAARIVALAALAAVIVALALLLRPVLLGAERGQSRAPRPPAALGGGERSTGVQAETGSAPPARRAGAEASSSRPPRIRWRRSVAVGLPEAGRLLRGVRLPAEGANYFTWDPIRSRQPNRGWRRWGTDDLVRTMLRVIRGFHAAHPGAPRIGIGDLSRPHGGDFGPQYGGIGHATHQNGLDADIYYPLRSGVERAPLSVEEIDLPLAQDLVDRFVAAGAVQVYVGPSTGLTGPPEVVQAIPNHDDHMHVRVAG
jgi:hypothetical protein